MMTSPTSTDGTSLLCAHIKDTFLLQKYKYASTRVLVILLLTYLTDWTDFSPKKLGLNPNTSSHHMRPWDVRGVSTLILQVSKYAKFSWHFNKKLLPQIAVPRDLNTKQRAMRWGRPQWCIHCISNANKTTSWSPLQQKCSLFYLKMTSI